MGDGVSGAHAGSGSDAARLKPVQVRRLRGGLWVAVAHGSEPLVVNATVASAMARRPGENGRPRALPPDLLDTLVDAGFTYDGSHRIAEPAAPPGSGAWRLARAGLWVSMVVLATMAAALLVAGGPPTGADLVPAGVHPALAVAIALGIAVLTAVPHELAHVVFGRTMRQRRGGVRLRTARASATTTLTHTWAWPGSARLAAVCAGLTVDLLFLVAALAVRAAGGGWVATVAVTVLVMRIVWQLRFHRNCDGRHALTMLIDDPVIDSDTRHRLRAREWHAMTTDNRLWAAALIVGVAAELSLVAVWLVPAAVALLGG